MFLVEFSPIIPEFGMFFWTLLMFLLVWFFLGKKAFGPIADALTEREESIQNALDQAEIAKQEMASLQASNEKLLQEAREERVAMLNEAKATKNALIAEAKAKAKADANKIISDAQVEIENQKNAALAEVKSQVGAIALDIAEKVLQKELKGDESQVSLVNKLVSEINNN